MKILIISLFFLLFSFLPSEILALDCSDPANKVECTFGTIKPPKELIPFTSPDPSGAGGISQFLSNLIALFYSIAAIVLIFMLVWGAFDWITSEGDKEKIDSARKKIINAIIGIVLFGIAFAVIQVLGQFTGFKFFQGQGPKGQSYSVLTNDKGETIGVECFFDNKYVDTIDMTVQRSTKDPKSACTEYFKKYPPK